MKLTEMKQVMVGAGVAVTVMMAAVILSSVGISLLRLQVAVPKTVVVTGTAEQTAVNQVAVFNANVSEVGESKEAVNQAMQEKVESLIQSAKDFGIAEENIKTQFFNIFQEETTNFEPEMPVVRRGPWRGNTNVSFSEIPVERAQDFAQLLVNSGATSIDGPSFQLEDASEIQNELIQAAIDDAREKAEQIAQNQGMRLGGIVKIDETGTDSGMYPLMEARGMGGGGGGFVPGSSEVSKSVVVIFELR